MRTTLTVDDDVAELRSIARRSGRACRDVVNETLRRGLTRLPSAPSSEPFRVVARDLGARRRGVTFDSAGISSNSSRARCTDDPRRLRGSERSHARWSDLRASRDGRGARHDRHRTWSDTANDRSRLRAVRRPVLDQSADRAVAAAPGTPSAKPPAPSLRVLLLSDEPHSAIAP